jgi:hypothetical protein
MGMWRRVFVGILLWAFVEGVTLQASLFGVFAGSIIDTHMGHLYRLCYKYTRGEFLQDML